MIYSKRIQIPLYKGALLIVVGNNVPAFYNRFPELREQSYIETPFATTFHHASIKDLRHHIVWFDIDYHIGGFDKITEGVVAHESVHLAIASLDRAGVPVNSENQESIAYLAEWFTDQICYFLKTVCNHKFE